jgi:putative ABC transport system ATP-binding protein
VAEHALRPGEPAIRCRGIEKVYGQGASAVQALRGVDLDVQAGELLMLVGPSGCGETTLISVMAGILDPTGGTCHVLGRDLAALPQGQRTAFRGRTIGFVFQAYNLLPALSALENVAVPLLILGEPRRSALARAAAVLERVGLTDRAHARPAQLSGGQQQRVAIARSLVHDPRVIVCDEPTSALDADTGHRVLEILREVAVGPDRCLIIVTHDARVFGFADRIARMDDGRVVSVTTNEPQPANLP